MDLNLVTDHFLTSFQLQWNHMLNQLGATHHQLSAGNRLRPRICLWGYLATVDPDRWEQHDLSTPTNVAISIEMIHKASLFLDDWIDGDTARHGLPTLHVETAPSYAVLLALKTIALSLYRLRNTFPSDVVLPQQYVLCLNTLVDTIYSMADGAFRELSSTPADMLDIEKVREISRLETSEIIGNSLLLGYYAGVGENRVPAVEHAFQKIGQRCGYLFQAMNDLEAFSNPCKLTEYKGDLNLDLERNRKNLAVALLYQIASKQDRARIKQAAGEELIALAKDYKIKEHYMCELDLVYRSLLDEVRTLSASGLNRTWCDAFCGFVTDVREFAQGRL